MEVYVEWVLINNYLTSAIVVFLAGKLSSAHLAKLRFFISPVAGSIFSVFIVASQDIALTIVLRIISSVIICMVAVYEKKQYLKLIRYLAMFIISNVIIMGVIFCVINIFSVEYAFHDGIIVSDNVITFLLAGIFAGICLTMIFKRVFVKLKLITDNICTVVADGISIKTLIDTGNKLFTPVSNIPAMIVDTEVFEQFNMKSLNHVIPYRTVSNSGLIYAFEPKKCKIIFDKKEFNTRIVIACAKKRIFGDYNAIINPYALY